jgi:hypothetical protein
MQMVQLLFAFGPLFIELKVPVTLLHPTLKNDNENENEMINAIHQFY